MLFDKDISNYQATLLYFSQRFVSSFCEVNFI